MSRKWANGSPGTEKRRGLPIATATVFLPRQGGLFVCTIGLTVTPEMIRTKQHAGRKCKGMHAGYRDSRYVRLDCRRGDTTTPTPTPRHTPPSHLAAVGDEIGEK